jgi:predicted negative regulator of RcsB-dependent stress response
MKKVKDLFFTSYMGFLLIVLPIIVLGLITWLFWSNDEAPDKKNVSEAVSKVSVQVSAKKSG